MSPTKPRSAPTAAVGGRWREAWMSKAAGLTAAVAISHE